MKTRIIVVAMATLLVGLVSCSKDKNEPAQNQASGSKTTPTLRDNSGQVSGNNDAASPDSIGNPGGETPTYVPLTGDQIFITVSKMDSMSLGGLEFRSVTANKYDCLNHTLLFDNNFSGQDLQIVFNAVMVPPPDFCEGGEDYAYAGTSWYPVSEGSHGFQVVLDGQTYSGSFVKTGSTYTFNWPYTSGVTLTPLILN